MSEYYQNNKEKILNQKKEYYMNKRSELINCECGKQITMNNIVKHKLTKYHIDNTTIDKYYQLTKYKNIYKNINWGYNSAYKIIDGKKIKNYNQEIIDNRNKFIEDYNIKHKQPSFSQCIKDYIFLIRNYNYNYQFYDHLEKYKTNDNKIVIIVSPYGPHERDTYTIPNDFTEIYKLYHQTATTFIKVISIEDIKIFNKNYYKKNNYIKYN